MAAPKEIKDTQSEPLPPLENIYFLMVTVKSAKDLERADLTGSSDPFCKVVANKQSWTTKTIMKNLNPEWNDNTSFVFFDAVESITFEVYDFDKGSKHDLIGTCNLEVKSFYDANSKGFKGTLNLTKCKHGSIDVEVSGRLVKPLELEERCGRLDEQCKKQSEEINGKKQEVEQLTAQNTGYTQEKQRLLGEQEKLNQQLANLREQIEAQKNKNTEKEAVIRQLKENNKGLENQINTKQQAVESKRQQTEEEQAKLDAAEKQHKSLEEEAANRRAELNQDDEYN
mmetsp:Transcript_50466/g.80369  ORF Transcript_50466/g.80369 Transcript_50466/m.80369 type:complete len:284 (+) Transcript_50466:72-923(+)|eukprot:CAMPEP_0197025280 /NCGR_PEP_ID=MMETSP1384-20130603/5669_1 /TAXON_ID=29189 /ORGANISM="Ammonia sp." /LENGTH=283 /DNA_ID=CAMNT_0042453797 /DNA_START=72 /DNA_END=923 /DNA_ORIENTATION=+